MRSLALLLLACTPIDTPDSGANTPAATATSHYCQYLTRCEGVAWDCEVSAAGGVWELTGGCGGV